MRQSVTLAAVTGLNRLKALVSVATQFVVRTECQLLVGLTVACLIVGEQYPFSNFPMYASFTDRTYYVYLADGADQPLPSVPLAGMSTPTLKKVYDGEVRRTLRRLNVRRHDLTAEQKQAIGAPILSRLRNSAPAPDEGLPEVLRLYQVDIKLRDGRFEKRRTLIAEER